MLSSKLKLVTVSIIILISALSVSCKHKKRFPFRVGMRPAMMGGSGVFSRAIPTSTIMSTPSRIMNTSSRMMNTPSRFYSNILPTSRIMSTPSRRVFSSLSPSSSFINGSYGGLPLLKRRFITPYRRFFRLPINYLYGNSYSCSEICTKRGYSFIPSNDEIINQLNCNGQSIEDTFCTYNDFCVYVNSDNDCYSINSNKK